MSKHLNKSWLLNDPVQSDNKPIPLKFLDRSQIEMIDEALEAVGSFGEVQLIVEKGRLRFVITKNSYDALKWHPDSIRGQDANALGTDRSSKPFG